MASTANASSLTGTTLKVYRFLYRKGIPLGIRDIQRGLGLSSPSVAEYHTKKLLAMGLVKEEESRFVVDKVVFENMIRIRRSIIPLQFAYVVFFALAFLVLLFPFRPEVISAQFIFSLVIIAVAVGVFSYQSIRNIRGVPP